MHVFNLNKKREEKKKMPGEHLSNLEWYGQDYHSIYAGMACKSEVKRKHTYNVSLRTLFPKGPSKKKYL